MSNLTIEHILNDIRSSDDAPENLTEKHASAEVESFSEKEIDSMTELLKQAEDVQPLPEKESEEEKVAEMLLFSAAMDTLEDAGKYEAFRKEALNQGYKLEDVDSLIEKKASAAFLGNLSKKQIAMGLGMGIAASGASAAGGYQYGKEKQKEKTKEVAQGAFRAGRIFQHQRQQNKMNMIKQRVMDYFKRKNQG